MMMFRNPMYQAEVEEQLEGHIKEDAEVAVRGVPLHHKLDLQVPRLPMHQLDQRTLESLVRTIVEEVGAVTGASTRMLAVKSQRDAFLFSLLHYFGTLMVSLGISKVQPWMEAAEISFICDNTMHSIADGHWDMGRVSVAVLLLSQLDLCTQESINE